MLQCSILIHKVTKFNSAFTFDISLYSYSTIHFITGNYPYWTLFVVIVNNDL